MKLFFLSQEQASGYDTYDSCVVVAKSEEDAKTIRPDDKHITDNSPWDTWANSVDAVSCKYLGEASTEMSRGVVCASFNAG